jgi:acyl carrier protein
MVFEKVRGIIASQLARDISEIKLESNLANDLCADSLDLVQLVILLEKEFGRKFDDDEIKSIKTVGDVVRFVETQN